MQSLYRVIKATETVGCEIIASPVIEKLKNNIIDEMDDETGSAYSQILAEAEEERRNIIKSAQASANTIINNALAEAEKIKKTSGENGYQDGYKNGYKEGYDFGINEAKKEAERIRVEAEQFIKSSQDEVQRYINNKKEEVILLAVNIARQVINCEISSEPEIVNKLAEKVLSKALDKKHVILKVNPNDFSTVKNRREELSIYVENPNNLFIVADSSIGPGSVKAETTSGYIDGTIDTQLEMIIKNLLRD